MVVYFDPNKGIVDSEQGALAQQQPTQMPIGLDPIGKKRWMEQQQQLSASQTFEQGAAQGKNKPVFADGPGQFFDEMGNILGNAITGLGTDYLDLAAGLGDVAVQTAGMLSGKGWDWDQVMNDSDNPWTQWRQQNFEAQTEAGQFVSNIVRVGTMVATLPKVGIKGLALAPRLASKLPVVGGAAGKVAKGLGAADDFLSSSRAVRQTTQLTEAAEGFKKGSAAAKAAKIASADDWLGMTFKEVSKLEEGKDWWRSVQDSTKALTQLTREKGRVRTVAEALGWDAFAAFNVYGEGDASFDETLNDMLAEAGLPNIPLLQTTVADTGIVRKLKQMAEGVATGVAVSGLLDMARVYRYSQAFGKATTAEKEALIKAFNTEADDIGRGLAKLQLPANVAPHPDIAARSAKEARLAGLRAGVETERIAQNYQRDLDVAQLMANQRMAGAAQDALPGSSPAGLLPEGEVQQLPGGPDPALLQGGPEAKPGSSPAGLLGAGGELVDASVQPVQIMDLGPRPPEPTVTPQTIRNAFQADMFDAFRRSQELTFQEGPDGVMRSLDELRGSVKQLMPRTRVDAIEYLNQFTPMANELGVVNASDSVWMNFITNRGLKEGWASIDPESMQVKFNRRTAVDLDRGEAAIKQAQAMDELNELNRYEEWLWNKELVNGNPQMRPEVQDNLAQKEARDAYDQWEASGAGQQPMEVDPAKADAERRLVTAAVEEDQLANAEELRLTAAEQAALDGTLDDATVVREYLGTTLDSVQRPEVLKAEVGRGWEVYGPDGELVATSRTKREAEKMAEAELKRSREALVNRARQMEADNTDQAMNVVTGNPIYDSDVVGKVTLTDAQINVVKKYSETIRRQLDADFIERTGNSAWFNVNDIKGSKRTFEMTQGDMYDIVDGIKALLQTGEIKGTQARVLKNIADKMDTSMKLLEPEARAQRFANNITADAKRFLDHGDFC